MTDRPWNELLRRQKEERIALVQNSLIETGGNRSETARRLGIGFSSIQKMIQLHGIDVPGGSVGKPGRKKGD